MSVFSVNPATNPSNEYYLARQSQMESNVRSYPRKLPLVIAEALGCWVTDVEGTKYLDCLAGMLLLRHYLNNCREAKKSIAYSFVDRLVQMEQKQQ